MSLTFNMTGTHLAIQDVRVRQAISYALNNEDIIDNVYQGYGTSNSNNNDIIEARNLLAEAGYEGGFDIKLVTTSSEADIVTAEIVQASLREININVQVEIFEHSTYLQVVADRDFDILISKQNMSKPGSLYDFYHTNGKNNISGFSNPIVDGLLETERTTVDTEERSRIKQEIYDKIAQEAPSIGFGARNDTIVIGGGYNTGITTCGGSITIRIGPIIIIIIWGR